MRMRPFRTSRDAEKDLAELGGQRGEGGIRGRGDPDGTHPRLSRACMQACTPLALVQGAERCWGVGGEGHVRARVLERAA